MEKYRGRVHVLLLYPDDETHVEALDKIAKSYDYCACLHDRDLWTEADEKKDPRHKAGTKKKDHIHVVIRSKNAIWNTALCKDLGITENYCEPGKNFDRALQYLLHYNDTDKAQYSIDEAFGTMVSRLRESIARDEKSEGEKVNDLITYIVDFDRSKGKLTVTQFASYCANNGYWAEFRRSASIFIKIIEEKNNKEI